MKSRHKAGTSNHCIEKGLGSAALTVAVLVIFFILILTTLFLLVLAGLAALLALSRLSGLTTLLTGLAALLALSELIAFLLHIVCHKNILLKKRETAALLRFKRDLQA